MARININLGTAPAGVDGDPVRTAFEKVNQMTAELYPSADLAKASGWGGSTPIVLTNSADADNLTKINGLFIFGNGGANIPTTFCYVEQMVTSGNFTRQTARDLVSNTTWERAFQAGVTGAPWKQVLKAGDFGLGVSTVPYAGNSLNADNYRTTGSVWGQFSINGNLATGHLVVYAGDPTNISQVFINSNGALFSRGQIAGVWSVFRRNYNESNSIMDPANGGLMNLSIISGWSVAKYSNGVIVMVSPLEAVASIAANTTASLDIALPVSLFNLGQVIASANVIPNGVYNYTVPAIWLPTASVARLIINNGSTAQGFSRSVRIEGQWK